MELATIQWQQDQLRKMVPILRMVVTSFNSQDTWTYRDGGTGWTVREVLGHLRDYEDVYRERLRLTVEQDNPPLPLPDPDELVAAGGFQQIDAADLYAQWAERRTALLEYLAARAESDWARTAEHPRRGSISLARQLALMAWHDVNHLEQMVHIVTERMTSAQVTTHNRRAATGRSIR